MQHFYHRLVVSEDINNRILAARKQGEFDGKPYQFLSHLVILGLREYSRQKTLGDFFREIGHIE